MFVWKSFLFGNKLIIEYLLVFKKTRPFKMDLYHFLSASVQQHAKNGNWIKKCSENVNKEALKLYIAIRKIWQKNERN